MVADARLIKIYSTTRPGLRSVGKRFAGTKLDKGRMLAARSVSGRSLGTILLIPASALALMLERLDYMRKPPIPRRG